MFGNLKIGQKLAIGFGLVLILGILVGGLAVVKMSSIAPKAAYLADAQMPVVDLSGKIVDSIHSARYNFLGFGLTENTDSLDTGKKELSEAEASFGKALTLAQQYNDPKLNESLKKAEAASKTYSQLMDNTKASIDKIQAYRDQMDGVHLTPATGWRKMV